MKHEPGDILSLHDFAKSQYTGAVALADEVEALFKAEFNIPRDAADTLTASGPRITRPARARAILEKFLTLLSVRATMRTRVVPHDTGEQETRRTTRLERWIEGYQRTYQMEVKKPVWRHFTYWYLLRGRGCIETRFDPSYLGKDSLPIRTLVHDPLCIFPVWGENGIGWYTKEYERYCWDVKKELDRKQGHDRTWRMPELPDDENEMVRVVEYWDDEYRCVLMNDQEVFGGPHHYGFVPLAQADCMDTPLADMEWAYNSVLGPIIDSLKQEYALASKMATGVDLFYWPKILIQDESGRASILDSGAPGVESYISPSAKVTVLNPTPNAQVISQLMGWLSSDIQLGSIPEIAWGAEPSSLQSGFAVSQVLGQIMDKIHDKKVNLEMALGWDWGHKLRLIERFGSATGFNSKVATYAEGNDKTGKRQKTMVEITPDDVDGHYMVEVTLTPELPQDRMVKAQLAQAFRAPGVDGKPLLDDKTILEEIVEAEHPDQVQRRIREQLLSAESQQVRDIMLAAAEQEWMETNKEIVDLAEKKEPMVPASKVKEMAELMAKEMHAAMMGQGGQLEAMMGMAEAGAGAMPMQPGAVQPGAVPYGGATTASVPGVRPEVVPSQMMGMVPEDEIPDLPELQQSQQRRAMSPPKP